MPRSKILLLGTLFIAYLFLTFFVLPKTVVYFVAKSKISKQAPLANIMVITTTPTPFIPTPVPTPIPTPRPVPKTIIIPSLNINTKIESVGYAYNGSMDVPKNAADVAWFEYGTVPGMPGNSVMAGHYDTPSGAPAIFYNLKNIGLYDTVTVIFDDNSMLNFLVTAKEEIPDDPNPNENTDYIFSKKPGTNLNLITCDGIWNSTTKRYSSRMVIYTSLK